MNPFEHPITSAKLKELCWKIDREVWAKVEVKEATTSWGREQTAKLICKYFGECAERKTDKMEPIDYNQKIPIRQWCAMCGQMYAIDFFAKHEIWQEAIHPHFQNSTVCLNCFTKRADEKFLRWEEGLELYPCSFVTQRKIQIEVEEKKPSNRSY